MNNEKPKLYKYNVFYQNVLDYFLELNFALLPSAPVSNGWKKILLRLRGSKVGNGVKFGRNLWIDNYSKLKIGDFVFFNYGCMILSGGGVCIEDNVLLGPGVTIISASHNTDRNLKMRTSKPVLGPVNIETGAWLAARCTILPGVVVGEGAVVAAGAVVTEDVEPFTIVGGVPARIIKRR